MKKNLIILFLNKINYVSNFFNYLLNINLKIKLIKIFNLFNNLHIKYILINDSFIKLNQFLKLLTKSFTIKKIFSYKKNNLLNNIFFFTNKLKIYKNFIFIIKNIFFYNLKKQNYFKSILNNLIYNEKYIF